MHEKEDGPVAERRMFAKTIIDSDAFLDMPLSTQALYFHLSMRADDDGFINNPKKIQRMVGCGDDDIKLLIAKRFILVFDSGVIVIKHWKIHNYIQKDRYKKTVDQEERAQLGMQENRAYTMLDTECIHNASEMETQVRLGKVRLGKESIGEGSVRGEQEIIDAPAALPPADSEEEKKPVKHKYGEYKNVLLTDEEYAKLQELLPDLPARIERLSEYIASTGKKYKSHYATIRSWANKDKGQQPARPAARGGYPGAMVGPNGIPIDPTKNDLDGQF